MSSFISRRTVIAGGLATAAALTLVACGSKSGKKRRNVQGIKVDGNTATITIGATPKPHVGDPPVGSGQPHQRAPASSWTSRRLNDYQTPNSR